MLTKRIEKSTEEIVYESEAGPLNVQNNISSGSSSEISSEGFTSENTIDKASS